MRVYARKPYGQCECEKEGEGGGTCMAALSGTLCLQLSASPLTSPCKTNPSVNEERSKMMPMAGPAGPVDPAMQPGQQATSINPLTLRNNLGALAFL